VKITVGLVFLGLVCVLINYNMNIGSSVVVDVLPDFVGYLLLCLSLEKVESSNRWFREARVFSTGMLVISVLAFIAQIRFFFSSWTGSIDSEVFAVFVKLLESGLSHIDCIIYAVTMLFAAFFSLAMMSEADSISRRGWSVTYTVFFLLYVVLAGAFVVLQFIQLPFSPYLIALPVNIVFVLVFYYSTKTLNVFEN